MCRSSNLVANSKTFYLALFGHLCGIEGQNVLCVCTSFPVDMTATTGNLWTLTSVMPTVASRPISDGPMCVPLANTHSPRLMSWPIGLCRQRKVTGVSGADKQCKKNCSEINIKLYNYPFSAYIILFFLVQIQQKGVTFLCQPGWCPKSPITNQCSTLQNHIVSMITCQMKVLSWQNLKWAQRSVKHLWWRLCVPSLVILWPVVFTWCPGRAGPGP